MSSLDDAAVARLLSLAGGTSGGGHSADGSPRRGEVVGERFELDAPIGEGGMSVVYRALDRATREVVAVKLVKIESASEEARFEREAGVLSGLRHPGVVRYIAHGSAGEGERFLATELYVGRTLADRLTEGPLSIADAVALGRRVAEALAAAHRAGVVHRDVKPSNLFLPLGDVERAVLLDFGIARSRGGASVTRTGTVVGTACYMAPEQVRSSRDVDARADVFSLGVVLYECVAGRAAFEAEDTETALAKVLLEDPAPLGRARPLVPIALAELIHRMLDRDPGRRPEDAGVVASELTEIAALGPTLAVAPAPAPDAAPRRAALRFAPGQVIADKYEVERVLGEGGMGVVVAARHRVLGSRVAIKLLRGGRSEDMARFLREAKAASRLESEHVVRVLDFGAERDGSPYMVMERLEGSDLGRLVRERGALPPAEAVDYVLQASRAIAEAHARGVVHRDLKPSNLFLTRRSDGSPLVKVLDFGVSKLTGAEDVDLSTLTAEAAVLGSPRYMSPEQLKGARDVDARTDVWALGAVLYELVTGRPAFDAPTAVAHAAAIASEPPAPLGDGVPAALRAVILRCLSKEARGRFQTVEELGEALSAIAREAAGRRGLGAGKGMEPGAARALQWVGAGVLGLVVLFFIALAWKKAGDAERTTESGAPFAQTSSDSAPAAAPVSAAVSVSASVPASASVPVSAAGSASARPERAASTLPHPPPRPSITTLTPPLGPSTSARPKPPNTTVDPHDPTLEER